MDNRRSRNHFVLSYLVRILARLVTLERLANGAKLDLVMLGHQIRDSSITCTLLWMPAATQHVRHEGILILMQSVQGVVIVTKIRLGSHVNVQTVHRTRTPAMHNTGDMTRHGAIPLRGANGTVDLFEVVRHHARRNDQIGVDRSST